MRFKDVNMKDSESRTALHYACGTGNRCAVDIIWLGLTFLGFPSAPFPLLLNPVWALFCSSEIARLLLESGADIEAIDSKGNTPLVRGGLSLGGSDKPLAFPTPLMKSSASSPECVTYLIPSHSITSILAFLCLGRSFWGRGSGQ